jgi:hypothetical protein
MRQRSFPLHNELSLCSNGFLHRNLQWSEMMTKRFWLLVFLLVGANAHALEIEYRIATGSDNLTTSFPSVAQLTGFTQITAVQVNNSSNQEIEVNCNSNTQPTTCSNGLCQSFHVPPGSTVSSPQNVSLSGKCWLRANSSTATSGNIYVVGWGW